MTNADKERIERLLLETGKTPAMKLVEIWLILNGSVEAERGGRGAAMDRLTMLVGVSCATVERTLQRLRKQGRIVNLDAGYRYRAN